MIRILSSSVRTAAVAPFSKGVVGLFGSSTRASVFILSNIIIITTGLSFTSSHTHIASDTDSAPLLGDGPTQRGTFGKTWELLRTEDGELCRLDLQPPVKRGVGGTGCSRDLRLAVAHRPGLAIFVAIFLRLLIEVETKTVFPLVADRKIWEDEVSRLGGSVKVSHSRHRHSC